MNRICFPQNKGFIRTENIYIFIKSIEVLFPKRNFPDILLNYVMLSYYSFFY